MQLPLQVTFEGLDPTDAIREHIDGHVEKLGRLGRSITHVRVSVSLPHRHFWRAAEYRVCLEVKVPHVKPMVVRATRSDDLYGCITEAFAAASRLLTSHAARMRAVRRSSGAAVRAA